MKVMNKKCNSLYGLLILICLITLFLLTSSRQALAAEAEKNPYLIKVNRVHNTVTIYTTDEKGQYSVPVKVMLCSVGVGGRTIKGTFQTQAKYRWKALMGDVWGQYATRIVGGILFHSVYYYENGNPATLSTKQYNKLGSAASHGCIRLSVEDAKWIYDHCAVGTTVKIYDSNKSPGPLGKPDAIKLASYVRWDPTDPDPNNPYKDTLPKISGAKNIKVALGKEVDLQKGVKAKSSVGMDITPLLLIEGKVDYNTPGKYEVTYLITDSLGRSTSKKITVSVGDGISTAADTAIEDSITDPEKDGTAGSNTAADSIITEDMIIDPYFTGITDRIVNPNVQLDRAFALSGVEIRNTDRKLDQELIEVTIEEISEDEYRITYRVMVDGKAIATEYASVLVDREAPVLIGITDHQLEAGEIPGDGYLMSGVTASDNITSAKDVDIKVVLKKNHDGTYLITYLATDAAGNRTAVDAKVYY